MSPTGKEYLALLGEVLPEILPRGFMHVESREPHFIRQQPGRTEEIGIRLQTKFWPYGGLDLTFGVSYDAFRDVFESFLNERHLKIPHIYHDTMNIHQMQGLRYLPRIAFMKLPFFWRFIDLGNWPCHRDESPRKAILRTKGVIGGVIEPFFARFSDIRETWNTLRDNDGWTLQGYDARTVLAFGVFVGDLTGVELARARLTRNCGQEGIDWVDRYLCQLQEYQSTKGKCRWLNSSASQ
jgi:hypothetical protein